MKKAMVNIGCPVCGGDIFMDNIGEVYYEAGIRYFELEKYEEAILNWIRAYELEYERENILENIYHCFIEPNEQEFRKNYEQSSTEFTKLPFEACMLDFIPLCEDKFYIFDWEEKVFQGKITLEKTPIQGDNIAFNNILYTDTWDIREMVSDMKKSCRDVVYILLEKMEARFVSFLKLPGFKENYLGNVIAFKDITLMRAFFEEYEEFYLPKQLVTAEAEKYWDIIGEIHKKRIHHLHAERKNIFLSICIPSYNRGKIVLDNVKHLLSCPYDSEIEIIVSNNGSTKGMEDYNAIKNIGDARVRYHEFAENQGYAANVLKTCRMARGKYAVLVSDEDWAILDNVDGYLSIIKARPEVGFFIAGVKGRGAFEESFIAEPTLGIIQGVSTLSYMTGFTYNMELCRRMKMLDILENLRSNEIINWEDEEALLNGAGKRNLYIDCLVHVCLALMLCRHAKMINMKIELWDSIKNSTDQGGFGFYYRPECRMQMQNGFMDFCYKALEVTKQELIHLFWFYCNHTYFLIRLSSNVYPDDMLKVGSVEEIQAWVCQEQIKYLDSFPIPLTEEEYSKIRNEIEKIAYKE